MSAAVRELRPVQNEVDEAIVERIEQVLAMAKRGELVAVVIGAQHRGRTVGTSHYIGVDGDRAHIITAIEQLKLRLLTE